MAPPDDYYPLGDDEEVERVQTTVRLKKGTSEDIDQISEIWNEFDTALNKKRGKKWKASTTMEQIIEVGVNNIWKKLGGRPKDKAERDEFVRRAIEAIRKEASRKK